MNLLIHTLQNARDGVAWLFNRLFEERMIYLSHDCDK